MGNSALGSLGRKAVAWIVLAFIALVLVKLAVAIVVGFVQAVLTVALLVALAFGVLRELRRI